MKTAKRKGKAEEIVDDFFDTKTSAIFDAVTEGRNGEWMTLCATAKYAAITRGIDPKDAEAVRQFLKDMMRDYSEAVHAPDGQRAMLPNGDWRIIRARRERNELAAAFLYREATQEVRSMEDFATAEREAKPRRGRPPNANGRRNFTPSAEKLLAAIAIIEALRKGRADTIGNAVAYCRNHPGTNIPPQTKEPGDGGANYDAFVADGQLKRWANLNGTTPHDLREMLEPEWQQRKTTLQ